MRIFNEIFFSCGLTLAGLGDSFVMSPIVHKFARESNKLFFPARRSNFETIKSLFQEASNIEVVHYSSEEEANLLLSNNQIFQIAGPDITHTEIYIPNLSQYVNIQIDGFRQLYEFYDIAFSYRYLGFQMPEYIDGSDELYNRLTGGDDNYVLLHQSTYHHPNGMNINFEGWRKSYNFPERKIIEIREGITQNMLHYKKLIENAKEIHCVPSSFFCLVDSMFNQTSAKLFYHDLRATTMLQVNSKWNNNSWNIVKYVEKI